MSTEPASEPENNISQEDQDWLESLARERRQRLGLPEPEQEPQPEQESEGRPLTPEETAYLKEALDQRAPHKEARPVRLSEVMREERLSARKRLQGEWSQQRRQARASLPKIPTREQAQELGLTLPDYRVFLRHTGRVKPSMDYIELPDHPDEITAEAYNLLPAFMNEYAEKYRRHGMAVRPSFLVRMWIQAMCPTQVIGKNPFAIAPYELRLVVDRMANPKDSDTPHAFNPRKMVSVATDIRLERQTMNPKERDELITQWQTKIRPYYTFYATVLPSREYVAADWVIQALYPAEYYDSNIPQKMTEFINDVVQFRFDTELQHGFDAVKARFVAEQMLIAVGYFIRKDRPLTPAQVYELAYRFPIDYIAEMRPAVAPEPMKPIHERK